MRRILFPGYIVSSLGVLALYFVLPAGVPRDLLWQLFVWGGVATLVIGPRLHGVGRRGPWWLLAVGLGLLNLGGTVTLPGWSGSAAEVARLLGDFLSLVGYPMIGLGALRMSKAQSGGKDHGPVLDSIIVTVALTTVLWEAVFARHGGSSMATSSLISLLVVSFSASWVAAMAIRLVLASGLRLTSAWLLFASSVAGFAGTFAFLWTGGQGRLITGGPVDAVWAAAILLVAASSAHPSMRAMTERQEDIETAQIWARTVLPAVALLTPPVAMLVRQATTGETATVAAGAAVIIAAVVIVRFADLVRARERSRQDSLHRANRESAVARLGECGLSDTPLDELLEKARRMLADELEVDGFRLEVRGDDDALGTDLPGSRGLVAVRSPDPDTSALMGEAFVSAVGHVLAAALTRRRTEEEMRHQSLHDPLTGLANRLLLDDRLGQALERRWTPDSGVAVVFVDLDGFKAVNDVHGHAAGDALLRCVADRLVGAVRNSDTVARFAGDEFVLVLEGVDASLAKAIAERVVAELRLPVAVGEHMLAVSASVGLVLADADGLDPDDLIRAADAAMYRAKDRGRNRLEVGTPASPGGSGAPTPALPER